jgi:ferredoxin
MAKKYRVGGGCALCLMCVYECAVGAISINENVSAVIDESKCVGCGRCYNNCQAEAIIEVKDNKENN